MFKNCSSNLISQTRKLLYSYMFCFINIYGPVPIFQKFMIRNLKLANSKFQSKYKVLLALMRYKVEMVCERQALYWTVVVSTLCDNMNVRETTHDKAMIFDIQVYQHIISIEIIWPCFLSHGLSTLKLLYSLCFKVCG